MSADEKTCPDCAEQVKAAALKCKHCGYRFEVEQEPPVAPVEASGSPVAPDPSNPSPGWADRTFEGGGKGLVGCLGFVVAAIGLFGVLFWGSGPDAPSHNLEPPSRATANEDNFSAKYAAEINLKAMFKDADAVKYQDVILTRLEGGNLMLCGKVNSKNSFGAYTGYKRFIASPNPGAPTLVEGEGIAAGDDGVFSQAYAEACSNVVERY